MNRHNRVVEPRILPFRDRYDVEFLFYLPSDGDETPNEASTIALNRLFLPRDLCKNPGHELSA